jgi:alkylation response protein AidB-like acyl-CoA dehydrogenase
VDFTLTDEQQLLRDTARALLARECPSSLVRAHLDDPAAADPLWKHLREWVELGDGPLVDLCLFLEETGAVVAPGPFLPTTALYRPLARAIGRDPRESGTVALAGASGHWVVDDSAVKTFVLEADRVAEVLFVVPGPRVIAVEQPATRLVATLDGSRRVFEADLPSDVPSGDGDGVPVDPGAVRGVVERATVALAAEMLGTARWLLAATVAYARERVQFDRPIGSFQAVQHKLADMALAWERAASAVAYAAMAVDAADDDRHRAVHVAKAAAGEAARRCSKDGMQIHGGIGYTWEHDLHLFLRRAYASEHLLGTTAWHHDRLADLLLG